MASANSQKDDHKKVVIEKNWDMKLGRWLANKAISYKVMSKWIADHTEITVSAATLNQMVLHRKFPKRNKDKIFEAIELFCVQNGLCRKEDSDQWCMTDKNEKPITEGATWRAHYKQKTYIQALEEDVNGKLIFDLPEAEMLTLQAKQQFKLMSDPFGNELSSPDQVYLGPKHSMVLEHMMQAARNGTMMCIYAECGAGKSTIKKYFNYKVETELTNIKIIEPVRVDKKQVTASTVSEAIMRGLNLSSSRTLSNEARDNLIKEALTAGYNDGNRFVLVIEEAHRLSDDVIKLLKGYWELGDGFKKLLGIILIGQSEMEQKLKNHFVREFTFRCTRVVLEPLGNELEDYIKFKLAAARAVPDRVLSPDAYPAISDALKGIHRYGENTGKTDIVVDQTFPLNVSTFLTNCMNQAADLCEPLVTAEVVRMVKGIH